MYELQYSPTSGTSTVTLIATFQSNPGDISNSFALGLIANQGTVNALSSKINAASDAAARGDKAAEGNALNEFVGIVTLWSNTRTGQNVTGIAVRFSWEMRLHSLGQIH